MATETEREFLDTLLGMSIELEGAAKNISALAIVLGDWPEGAITRPTRSTLRDAFDSIGEHVLRVSKQLMEMADK